jgi:hypothetical protein
LVPEISFQFREISINFCFGCHRLITVVGADDHQPEAFICFPAVTAGYLIDDRLFFYQRIKAGIFMNYNCVAVNPYHPGSIFLS